MSMMPLLQVQSRLNAPKILTNKIKCDKKKQADRQR